MNQLLELMVLLPLAGFVLSLLMPECRENPVYRVACGTILLHGGMTVVLLMTWWWQGRPLVHITSLQLFYTPHLDFTTGFMFDGITACYALVGLFVSLMVILYSRCYMHREPGYKRFFSTVLFFYSGYNLVIYAGNMETMFIGWEILGVTSFLLIAFYRDRYLPVKNALKVFSIYRTGDVGLLFSIWMLHHLFGSGFSFHQLSDMSYVLDHQARHYPEAFFTALMLLLAAFVKSAQLPFSCWLPRAMEGPTPSSAIFYGALAVHMGVFLLLRTENLWQGVSFIPLLIGVFGLATSVVATLIARCQSAIKAQIAYASVAQIGLIFIEISCGFKELALLHFAGNAFLRTYQLLVSPSVVAYLIRQQGQHDTRPVRSIERYLPDSLQYRLYLLSLQEFALDRMLHQILWQPLKTAGAFCISLLAGRVVLGLVVIYLAGLSVLPEEVIPASWWARNLPLPVAGIALLLGLAAFAERGAAWRSWLMIIFSHYWIALAISLNTVVDPVEVGVYLSGVSLAGACGFVLLWLPHACKGQEGKPFTVRLDGFHGMTHRHPWRSWLFLLAGLGCIGFPISPTLIGEDLMFSHIRGGQVLLAALTGLDFIVIGLVVMRIYARVYLGADKSMAGSAINRSA